VTIVDVPRPVTGGVDTHLDLNVAAALDPIGGLLAVAEFPATSGGHRRLLGWLAGFGPVARVGVEGTGSYGAGLARYLRAAGVEVAEVDRPNRQARRRAGKSDHLDAVEAARAALSGRARGAAKSRDGNVEAIRALVVAKRSARSAKIQALNQIRHLSFTAPEELRQGWPGSPVSGWPLLAGGADQPSPVPACPRPVRLLGVRAVLQDDLGRVRRGPQVGHRCGRDEELPPPHQPTRSAGPEPPTSGNAGVPAGRLRPGRADRPAPQLPGRSARSGDPSRSHQAGRPGHAFSPREGNRNSRLALP
jgi:Transposase